MPVGPVLVKEEPLFRKDVPAEEEEPSRHFRQPRAVQRGGGQRAVPRPDVRVGVARELGDVVVGGGHDAAPTIAVEPGQELASAVEVVDLW